MECEPLPSQLATHKPVRCRAPRPESGRDCLVCAIFARKRGGNRPRRREGTRTLPGASLPPALPPLPPGVKGTSGVTKGPQRSCCWVPKGRLVSCRRVSKGPLGAKGAAGVEERASSVGIASSTAPSAAWCSRGVWCYSRGLWWRLV